MTAPTSAAPAAPLGVVGALAAGFEAVNARLELAVFPLLLDLWLWLGPRLSIRPLVAEIAALLAPPPGVDAATLSNLRAFQDLLLTFGERFNLFSLLSTAPLGVPSLMAARSPLAAPGGQGLSWLVSDGLLYLLLMGAIGLAGLFLGALYFGALAQQVRDGRLDLARLAREVWGDWFRLALLAAGLLGAGALLGLPLMLFAGIGSLLNPTVGAVISLAGFMLVLIAGLYLAFSLPGLFLQRRSLPGAVWDSLRLTHASLSPTATLFLAVLVLNGGLAALWNLPADDSWLLLVGLAGHALVVTALLAATFAYYQDRYRWWVQSLTAARRPAAGRNEGIPHG